MLKMCLPYISHI
nr:unnamed protein product [Callosobruchus analis]